MTIAKKCIGCQSNTKQGTIQYYNCQIVIGIYRDYKQHAIFRNNYCPCVQCLVKATCTDPKVTSFGYRILSDETIKHKCDQFRQQILKFRKHRVNEKPKSYIYRMKT